jgi:MarR family 2-MHQ and catechol resistance regulon transcriptional repressor
LHLTEKGRALIESLFPAHAATIAAAIGVLSSEETATLARLCRTIGTSAGSDTTEIEVS